MNYFLSQKIKHEGLAILWNLSLSLGIFWYLSLAKLPLWQILPICFIFLFIALKHLGQFGRSFRGAYGEDEAYAELKHHFKKYTIIKNFYTGRGDIDFLLIGPSGIIIVEVKNLKYPLKVNDKRIRYGKSDFLYQLEKNTEYVKRKLRKNKIRVPLKSFIWVLGEINGKSSLVVNDILELKKKNRKLIPINIEKQKKIISLFSKHVL